MQCCLVLEGSRLPLLVSPQTPAGRMTLDGGEVGRCHRPRGRSAAKEKSHLPSPVPHPSCALPLPRWCLPLKPRVEGKPLDSSPYHLHRLAGQGQLEMAFWSPRQHSQAR